jgi:hypothetical protein
MEYTAKTNGFTFAISIAGKGKRNPPLIKPGSLSDFYTLWDDVSHVWRI